MNSRRTKSIQSITCIINNSKMALKKFCMTFMTKPIKCMNTTCVFSSSTMNL